MSKSKPPLKKYKCGRVNATIWLNEGEKGPYFSINFNRRYKDEAGEYKTVTSFGRDDLTDLIAAAELAIASIPIQERIAAADEAEEEE